MQIDFTFTTYKHNPNSTLVPERSVQIINSTQTYNLTCIPVEQFPIAFITHVLRDNESTHDEHYLYESITPYRAYKNNVFIARGIFNNIDLLKKFIEIQLVDFRYVTSMTTSIEAISSKIQAYLDTYVIVNEREVWQMVSEPIYEVRQAYGRNLTHSVGIFIGNTKETSTHYRFNALQKQEAQTYCAQIAKEESTKVGMLAHIDVFMPEMVKYKV